MTSGNERDIQNQKVAKLWGSSWQKLSPKQRQLVGDIMQDVKIVSIGDPLEVEVSKMPPPEFANVTPSDRSTYFSEHSSPEPHSNNVFAITWQSVLEKTTDALVEQQKDLKQLQFIFQELDYQQITNNTISDISAIVRQPADLEAIATLENQIELLKELLDNYFLQSFSSVANCCEISLPSDLDDALKDLVQQAQSLGLLGLGAFTLAANLHLLLLHEKVKFLPQKRQNLNCILNNYIAYAKSTIPLVFRLTVGKIDKACTCTKYYSNFDENPEYECLYSDGKDMYIFRDRSERAGYECNKHRLRMFHCTVDRLMQIIVQPLRSTIKAWEKLAVQMSLSPM
ncbi:MAG: hypothetical protein N4J56_000695 [Chroococcidiopsis sp. SAG 2025]|uniref:hypothetical protein n=1 Tax=Chroococcidiopsis sp. SAG 2025 TaxID=171389 RepID=UPI0029370728|nr:hypothetical protein [Chroococcidiopsis sp. SAG 2025]MDV2991041.1 hypothetical protein [Chroococcidiopsis sp. SAG 2025]